MLSFPKIISDENGNDDMEKVSFLSSIIDVVITFLFQNYDVELVEPLDAYFGIFFHISLICYLSANTFSKCAQAVRWHLLGRIPIYHP